MLLLALLKDDSILVMDIEDKQIGHISLKMLILSHRKSSQVASCC